MVPLPPVELIIPKGTSGYSAARPVEIRQCSPSPRALGGKATVATSIGATGQQAMERVADVKWSKSLTSKELLHEWICKRTRGLDTAMRIRYYLECSRKKGGGRLAEAEWGAWRERPAHRLTHSWGRETIPHHELMSDSYTAPCSVWSDAPGLNALHQPFGCLRRAEHSRPSVPSGGLCERATVPHPTVFPRAAHARAEFQ